MDKSKKSHSQPEQSLPTNTPKKKSTRKKSPQHSRFIPFLIGIAVIIVITSIVLLAVIPRRPRCKGLVGTWRYSGTEYSGSYQLTFNDDGSGIDDSDGNVQHFTYIDHGETFSSLYAGDQINSTSPYKITDDNTTLTLTDSQGSEIIYTCE